MGRIEFINYKHILLHVSQYNDNDILTAAQLFSFIQASFKRFYHLLLPNKDKVS